MKNIHIVTTSERRILAIECPSDIPNLLGENEIIEGERFYQAPKLLEKFFKENPDQLTYFLKGFAYWVEFKVKGFNEHPGRFGLLKRTIQKFSTELFQKIRALSGRIAEEVKKIIKPKKTLYKEQRKQKLISRGLTSKKNRGKFYISPIGDGNIMYKQIDLRSGIRFSFFIFFNILAICIT